MFHAYRAIAREGTGGHVWPRPRIPGEGPAERAPRFYTPKEGVLRALRARGRDAVDKEKSETAHPSYPVFLQRFAMLLAHISSSVYDVDGVLTGA